MALISELSIPAAELYFRRFCAQELKTHVIIAHPKYRPLVEFANIDWRPRTKAQDHVLLDDGLVPVLTSGHFNLIQANASAFGQMFVWFPPRTQPSGDEGRLLVRAGVPLKFVPQRIGVYIRGVTKYN